MKNLRRLLFWLLLLLYAAGVFIGAARELRAPEQAELYRYLEEGIRGGEKAEGSGIRAAARENLTLFALLAVGGAVKPLLWLPCAAMLIKGYLTGFSVMAAMRLYGIKGGLLCVSGFISAAMLIPAAAYYGSINAGGMLCGEEKSKYYKKFLIATFFLTAIFCADALIKGTLSPIFVKWASGLLANG